MGECVRDSFVNGGSEAVETRSGLECMANIGNYLIQYGIKKQLFLEAERPRRSVIDPRKITEEELTFRLIFLRINEISGIPETMPDRSLVDLTRVEKEKIAERIWAQHQDDDGISIIFCKLPAWLEKNAKYLP